MFVIAQKGDFNKSPHWSRAALDKGAAGPDKGFGRRIGMTGRPGTAVRASFCRKFAVFHSVAAAGTTHEINTPLSKSNYHCFA
jgi:hypothetical protein